jgi:NAD(P)-dependent dehydrogenase (short-subunit alcohol dehydrogenase family)
MTTVLITGATDGLGRGVAAELSRRGAKVLVHGRDRSRAEAVASEVGAAGMHLADLSSFDAVREMADGLPPFDVLVNNAGVISPERVVTQDGCELTLQVNHLSHFLLTNRLLERDAPPRRIVHVASAGQQALDFGDLMLEHDYEPWRAYRQSKLAQIMFSNELADRRPDVETTSLHPATFMDTKMVRQTIGEPHSTVEEGIEATVRLIDEPDIAVTGRYFNGKREAEPDPQARDPEARRRLWEVSERLTA